MSGNNGSKTSRKKKTVPDVPMSEAEFIASAFHTVYEAKAPEFGYDTRSETQKPWQDVRDTQNGQLMVATAQALLDNGVISKPPSRSDVVLSQILDVCNSDLSNADALGRVLVLLREVRL